MSDRPGPRHEGSADPADSGPASLEPATGQEPARPSTSTSSSRSAATSSPAGRRRPGQVLECGQCGGPVRLARTGRTRKWCSDACRHQAWQTRQALAAATDQTVVDVRVVDRLIEVAVPVPVVERVEVTVLPKGAGWAPALLELAAQLDSGRLYDRDLRALAAALHQVNQALGVSPLKWCSSGT